MSEVGDLSEAKRALLAKYLAGQVSKPATATPATVVVETPAQSAPGAASVQETPAPPAQSEQHQETRAPIMPLQPRGTKRPIFYFHVHWIGGAFYCFNIARDFGTERPFYVCEPYKVDGLSMAEYPSLEKMAADYLESMRRVQPEGPYLMVGFCGGGLIAFEIAKQLHAKGESVEQVVLIEPRAGPSPQRLIWPRIFRRLIGAVGAILRLNVDQQFNLFISCRHFYLTLRYWNIYRKEKDYRFWPKMEVLHRDWMAKFVWTIAAYSPGEYPGKATFFWAEEKPSQRRLGWGRGSNAREVEVHIVPGTHDSCRTDHLAELSSELKRCIERS